MPGPPSPCLGPFVSAGGAGPPAVAPACVSHLRGTFGLSAGGAASHAANTGSNPVGVTTETTMFQALSTHVPKQRPHAGLARKGPRLPAGTASFAGPPAGVFWQGFWRPTPPPGGSIFGGDPTRRPRPTKLRLRVMFGDRRARSSGQKIAQASPPGSPQATRPAMGCYPWMGGVRWGVRGPPGECLADMTLWWGLAS